MYKKILAPLDGSELAECTLSHLSTITTGAQISEIVLMMVVEPISQAYEWDLPIVPEDLNKANKKSLENAKDYLSKVASSIQKKGTTIGTVALSGKAADEILEYADKNQIDLILMSTHGRSGVSRWALGSVTAKVLSNSAVPVLVIRPEACIARV